MKILVLNSGSSSIKFQVIDMPASNVLCSGLVERIGLANAGINYKTHGNKYEKITSIPDHTVGLQLVTQYLFDNEIGVANSADDISAVGHRVVHGGSFFSETMLIGKEVKNEIKSLFGLAPLHNPANFQGIEVAEQIFTNAKQVVVFDTSFHQSIPEKAYKYAVPNEFLDEHHIRLYGFHGTSHKYVSEKATAYLGAEKSSKVISVHLGNGCSITAIKDGKSIDHSLGFAPMNGLIMGTRSGDIDQSVIFYLMDTLGYNAKEVSDLLQKKSGMLGLTGYSDMREVIDQADAGNKECQLALAMNTYRIKKYVGAYTAVLSGLDAIIFTGGIGENSALIRHMSCQDMDYLGISLDDQKNSLKTDDIMEIQSDNSKVKVLVVPTNEELEIAKQTYTLISSV